MPCWRNVSYVPGQDDAAQGGMGGGLVSHLVMHGLFSPPNRQFAMLNLKLSGTRVSTGARGREAWCAHTEQGLGVCLRPRGVGAGEEAVHALLPHDALGGSCEGAGIAGELVLGGRREDIAAELGAWRTGRGEEGCRQRCAHDRCGEGETGSADAHRGVWWWSSLAHTARGRGVGVGGG